MKSSHSSFPSSFTTSNLSSGASGSNSFWKCTNCGITNSRFVDRCSCGRGSRTGSSTTTTTKISYRPSSSLSVTTSTPTTFPPKSIATKYGINNGTGGIKPNRTNYSKFEIYPNNTPIGRSDNKYQANSVKTPTSFTTKNSTIKTTITPVTKINVTNDTKLKIASQPLPETSTSITKRFQQKSTQDGATSNNKVLEPEKFHQSTQQQFNFVKSLTPIDSRQESKQVIRLRSLLDTIEQEQKEYQKVLRKQEQELINVNDGNNEDRKFVDIDFAANRSSLYRTNDVSTPEYDKLIWERIDKIPLLFRSNADQHSIMTQIMLQSIILPSVISARYSCPLMSKKKSYTLDQVQKITSAIITGKSLCVRGAISGIEDFRQGRLGDCWFQSSLSALVWHQLPHLSQLLPDANLHDKTGSYQTFLCVDGQWNSLVIDDRFPVDPPYNHLVFAEPLTGQLYALILEKALAKHHSCYKALHSGTALEGFSNLTGMPVKRITLREEKKITPMYGTPRNNTEFSIELATQLRYLIRDHYLIVASCSKGRDGLHSNHAYTVLDITTPISIGRSSVSSSSSYTNEYLLLWNPWGEAPKYNANSSLDLANRIMTNRLNTTVSSSLMKSKLKLPKLSNTGNLLVPGMFWISLKQFCECFSTMDVCLFNTKWDTIVRYRFSLPICPTEQQQQEQRKFTMFEMTVNVTANVEFTIYQPIHRDLSYPFQLDLNLVIFRQPKSKSKNDINFDSLELVAISERIESKVASYGRVLQPGKYLITVIGFNHWGQTSRFAKQPMLTLACHAAKSIIHDGGGGGGNLKLQLKPLEMNFDLLGDLLVTLTIQAGKMTMNDPNTKQHTLSEQLCCAMTVMENLHPTKSLVINWNTSQSVAVFNVRSTPDTSDWLPPQTKQLIALLVRESDKTKWIFHSKGTFIRSGSNNDSNDDPTKMVHPDVKSNAKLSALFAPRKLFTISKKTTEGNSSLLIDKLENFLIRTSVRPIDVYSPTRQQEEEEIRRRSGRGSRSRRKQTMLCCF